ncbi:MAG: YihY/virulence factor BrkB family protein [Lachnospiraceae bacterium]|nr:YihY/virulence factor BrkB family protein [Lachnospiraceae bacterium]
MQIIKKLYKIYDNFARSVKRLNIDAYAACTSFFLLLSITPLLILLCSILPLTKITEADLIFFIEGFLPEMFWSLLKRLVDSIYAGGYTILTVSAIVTLWTAAKGVASLVQGLNAVYDVEEKRNYFVRRGVCCLYTLILLGAIYISLLLMVFGKMISDYLISVWPWFEEFQGFIVKPRHLYIFLILTLFFAVLYSFLPNKKQKFREQLPGAAFSALCWIGFSAIFSYYVNHYNAYSMYGNLAIVIVAMIWIYFCLLFFLYGAYLNRYFKPVNIVLVYPKKKRDMMSGATAETEEESALFGKSLRKPLGHENDDKRDEEMREDIVNKQDYLE